MRTIVEPEGRPDALITIVGEAPGADEERFGRPFVGRAGQLLDRILTSVRINRQDCYILNVLDFRPNTSNDITPFIDLSKKIPYIHPDAQACIAKLKERIEASSSNVIVAMGNTALYVLTGHTAITKYRGSILPCTLVPGRKVVACIHPSAALRVFTDERLIAKDLDKAREQSKFPDIRIPQPLIIESPTFSQVTEILEMLRYCKFDTGFDIEVMYGHTYCVGLAWRDINKTESICINFMKDRNHTYTVEQEAEIWQLLAAILESPHIRKIMQNGIFDCAWLYNEFGIRPINLDDTMIAHALLLPDYPKGLDFITSTYTDYPYYKEEGKVWKKLYFDEPTFWRYNARDAIVCLEVMPKMREDLRQQKLLDTYQCHIDLMQPFMFIQARGIKVDHVGLANAQAEADRIITAKSAELIELVGHDINPASPKQIANYFYIEKGLQPYRKPGGGITTDETALKRLKRRGFKEAEVLLDLRYWQKLKGTYFDMTFDDDQRFRGSINVVGTKSGRPSSSKSIRGTGGNMFNQPKEMSKFFVADENQRFAILDLSQAENRIVAYLAPEASMIEAFETGKDVHCLTGALISGQSYEDTVAQYEVYQAYKDKGIDPPEEVCSPIGKGDDPWRQWGKKCNHALNYGLGYKKFALLCEILESESLKLVNAYHRAYPGVEQGYQAWIKRQLGQDRTLINPYGRRRVFLDRWSEDLFREAFSWIPQSIVAYKMWYGAINPLYYDPFYQSAILVNCVYDSVDIAFDVNNIEKTVEILTKLKNDLEQPIEWRAREIKIPVEIKIGTSMDKAKVLKDVTIEGLRNVIAGDDKVNATTKAG